jgi:hypothetical protein
MKDTRLPSYIPARTFALALLDILGYDNPDVRPEQAAPVPAPTPGEAAGAPLPGAHQRAQLNKVLELLQRESPLDVSEHLGGLKGLLENTSLPNEMKVQLVGAVTNAQTRLQKLHDSTEVWFNNSMDRVSGAYKRHTQAFLFLIGMVLACMLNADTIQLWKRLATEDALRTAVAQQAARYAAEMDTAAAPDAAPANPVDPQKEAAEKYRAARAALDSLELKLGWTWEEAAHLGVAARDASGKAIPRWNVTDLQGWRLLAKALGLLMTALAISMGAPFWFDTLNKVISIRGAGRSPAERAKSPEGPAKRAAEQPNK